MFHKFQFLLVILMIATLGLTAPVAAQTYTESTAGTTSTVVIYGTDDCPHTQAALRAYPDHIYYNVNMDQNRMNELLSFTGGQPRWPVIIKDGQVIIGYQGGGCGQHQ